MVSGMISTEESDKTTVTLANPSVRSETRTNPCWDVTLNVQKITPKDVKVKWTELRVIIKSDSGSILNTASTVAADDDTLYNDPAGTGPAVVQFWFVEVTTGDDKLDAGDGIKITGMDNTYEGADVEFTKGGERIASATLPTNFP
jgi:hypothetical protein